MANARSTHSSPPATYARVGEREPGSHTSATARRALVVVGALAALLVVYVTVQLASLLGDAYRVHVYLGHGATVVVAVAAALVLVALVGSASDYLGVRRQLRRGPVLLHEGATDRMELERAREALTRTLDRLPHCAARERLRTSQESDCVEWLWMYDRELLVEVDRRVAEHMHHEASSAALLAVASTRGGLDAVLLLWRQVRLVRFIALAYGRRPGLFGTLVLAHRALLNSTLAATLDELGGVAGELVIGNALGGRLAGGAGEALGNAALIVRMGRHTVDECRPIRNRSAAPYSVGVATVSRGIASRGLAWVASLFRRRQALVGAAARARLPPRR